jgi:hypothetical protein
VEPHIDLVYEMHLSLWGLNYNFPRYVLHFGYWLDQRLSAIEDRNKRLDKLLTYIHDIEQMKVKQGFIFIPTLEPLSEQLLASISTTYKYLFLPTAKNGHEVVEKIRNKPAKAKIKLSVSVSVVALWIKILMLAGIIVNTNKSDVFRAVADLIETQQSEDVSPDSIKGKFNNTPPVTYGQMRDILLRMMDILKQF